MNVHIFSDIVINISFIENNFSSIVSDEIEKILYDRIVVIKKDESKIGRAHV